MWSNGCSLYQHFGDAQASYSSCTGQQDSNDDTTRNSEMIKVAVKINDTVSLEMFLHND